MSKHGYEVQAEEVFWVSHGVLRSTDLRDSMDEQCVADIAASIVGGELVDDLKTRLIMYIWREARSRKKSPTRLRVRRSSAMSLSSV